MISQWTNEQLPSLSIPHYGVFIGLLVTLVDRSLNFPIEMVYFWVFVVGSVFYELFHEWTVIRALCYHLNVNFLTIPRK